ARSNKIDMRRTMRQNMKYGGVPIDLVHVKKKPHRKQHLFLNDVSGSCEWISSWFFMLMFACQKTFKDSRMFEFDNKTIETTEFLKEKYYGRNQIPKSFFDIFTHKYSLNHTNTKFCKVS
ncbi:MAG: VWA domain-containing protein, partial [Phascolarctobacterium sp.]|nr:VWA domain-containing protein [Phascolarctobacterium sp.]